MAALADNRYNPSRILHPCQPRSIILRPSTEWNGVDTIYAKFFTINIKPKTFSRSIPCTALSACGVHSVDSLRRIETKHKRRKRQSELGWTPSPCTTESAKRLWLVLPFSSSAPPRFGNSVFLNLHASTCPRLASCPPSYYVHTTM